METKGQSFKYVMKDAQAWKRTNFMLSLIYSVLPFYFHLFRNREAK